MRRLLIGFALPVLVSCSKSAPTGPPAAKLVQVSNYLYLPISISFDGSSYGAIRAGIFSAAQTTYSIPASIGSISYVLQPLTYSDGTAILGDLNGETVVLPGGDIALGINNIVRNVTYFYPHLMGPGFTDAHTKYGTDTVSFDVGTPAVRRCFGSVSGNFPSTNWAYFTLTEQTELRIFAGNSCAPSRLSGIWSSSRISSAMSVNSGEAILSY